MTVISKIKTNTNKIDQGLAKLIVIPILAIRFGTISR